MKTGEFDDIRPYRDDEIPAHIELLLKDPSFIPKLCQFKIPRMYRICPPLIAAVIRTVIRRTAKRIRSQDDLHRIVAEYVKKIVDTSTLGFTYSGVENLPLNEPVLLISNHRDIALDSIFVNYALWLSDRPRTQIAVGENLFTQGFETEFMRINGSFIVKRSAESARKLYMAMNKTSRYIRQTLESGSSIWIAQREGRSKDGNDQTDPAILKMFMLAYRKELDALTEWLDTVNLVPVAITYELDPCAPLKARELSIREAMGHYTKADDEDFRSIARGLNGQKGHVHVGFGHRIHGEFQDAETLATEIDHQISELLQPYPTFREAARLLQDRAMKLDLPQQLKDEFEKQLSEVAESEQRFLLQQYANQCKA